MYPILFPKTAKIFNTNGLGRLTEATACKVTEERNGQYELQLTYPITGRLYKDIELEMIVACVPAVDSTVQAFEIYRITKPINGLVEIYAQHISYRLSKILTTGESYAASPTACASAINSLKAKAILAPNQTFDFSFWTDNRTVAQFKKSIPTSVRSRLGGSEGSLLDQFGGEYEWDNFTVKLHKERGTHTNITLRYGKNLTDLTQEEANDGMVTGVLGYWKNQDDIITGSIQLASNHANYATEKIISVDFSQQLGTETRPSVDKINNLAQIYANSHNVPNVSLKVSFVDLSKTEEYKNVAPLEKLHLCDYVTVDFPKLKVRATARVIKTVYDVLLEKYETLEIGDTLRTLSEAVTDTLAETINDLAGDISDVATEAIRSTAWLTSGQGHVVAIKNSDGSWKELLFIDTSSIATAKNVLRLNENGLGFSTSGVGGTYRNAWTIDGKLNADFITTGTLNADRVRGGTLELGKSYVDGALVVKNTSGQQILKADKNGVVVTGVLNATSGVMQKIDIQEVSARKLDIQDELAINAKLGTTEAGYNASKSPAWQNSHHQTGVHLEVNNQGLRLYTDDGSEINLYPAKGIKASKTIKAERAIGTSQAYIENGILWDENGNFALYNDGKNWIKKSVAIPTVPPDWAD